MERMGAYSLLWIASTLLDGQIQTCPLIREILSFSLTALFDCPSISDMRYEYGYTVSLVEGKKYLSSDFPALELNQALSGNSIDIFTGWNGRLIVPIV